MKSAYELAMERFKPEGPVVTLTDEQRAALAEVDALYQSKVAEKEVFLSGLIAKAMGQSDFGEAMQLEEQKRREISRLEEKREHEKEALRKTWAAS